MNAQKVFIALGGVALLVIALFSLGFSANPVNQRVEASSADLSEVEMASLRGGDDHCFGLKDYPAGYDYNCWSPIEYPIYWTMDICDPGECWKDEHCGDEMDWGWVYKDMQFCANTPKRHAPDKFCKEYPTGKVYLTVFWCDCYLFLCKVSIEDCGNQVYTTDGIHTCPE